MAKPVLKLVYRGCTKALSEAAHTREDNVMDKSGLWFVKTAKGHINLNQVQYVVDTGEEVVVHFGLSNYLTIPIKDGGADVLSAMDFMKFP
jgi:hypothetical protein